MTQFDPEHRSYRRSVQSGAIVTGAEQVVVILCQFLSVIILSRLLSPADFGIVAMSWPVIGLLSLFQDFGLTQATIQKRGISAADVNFLFWLNLAISGLVTLAVLAAAPLAAYFYGEPRVEVLLLAMSSLILIQGLGAQHAALLSRLMRFRLLALARAAGAVAGLVVSVAWALITPTYWALFGGSLMLVLIPAALAWVFSAWRPSLPRMSPDARGLINFGAGLTGFNVANFFSRNADNVLIGRFLGEVQLGLYDRAYKLMLLPLRQVTNPLSRVMVPALSRLNDSPERYRRAFLTVMPVVLLAIQPGVVAMIVVAEELVPFLLGERWRESAAIFGVLGLAGLLQPLNNPAGWLFISQGRSREFMHWGIVTAVTSIAGFAIGIPYGVLGVAAAFAVTEYLRTPFLWWYVGRAGPVTMRNMLVAAGPILLGTHLALPLVWLLKPAMPSHPLLQAASAAFVAYLAVGAIYLLFPSGRELLRTLVDLAPPRIRAMAFAPPAPPSRPG